MIRNLDTDLIRAFVTVIDTGSFTTAGEKLLRTQSTISLQINRLEKALGHRLMNRNPHAIDMTPDGEAFLPYARQILRLHDEAFSRLTQPDLSGKVRLGAPEDFATFHLPDILSTFSKSHPNVALEVTCDLTLNLLAQYRTGQFDLVLLKREPQDTDMKGGHRVWRESLVWAASDTFSPSRSAALPLIVSPDPCVYRRRAIDALNGAGLPWRMAYVCGSLAGTQAAVRAGLGITVLPKEMVPEGLAIVDDRFALPPLRETEIALMSAESAGTAALRLKDHMITSLESSRT